jgi:hypothetical protein
MDSRTGVRWVIGVGFLMMVVGLAAADKDRNTISTRLSGLEETTATIQTPASGEFKAVISEDGTSIKYEETWRNLSSTVTQSHIHFGRPGLSGQIVLYLCTNLAFPPAPPAVVTTPPQPTPQGCPLTSPATITGVLTAADVFASAEPGGQGIDGGAEGFAEMVKAIKTGSAYVNVHSVDHPSGEIRGRLPGFFPRFRPGQDDRRDDHHDDGGHQH